MMARKPSPQCGRLRPSLEVAHLLSLSSSTLRQRLSALVLAARWWGSTEHSRFGPGGTQPLRITPARESASGWTEIEARHWVSVPTDRYWSAASKSSARLRCAADPGWTRRYVSFVEARKVPAFEWLSRDCDARPAAPSTRQVSENWEFDESGLMRWRHSSIHDLEIAESERKFYWELATPRPTDHPGSANSGCEPPRLAR